MADFDHPIDPPSGWTRQHLDEYVSSGGERGHDWNGVHTLLLTTLGRRSGRAYRTPLIYGRHGDEYLIVASKGGTPEHPLWYRNLDAHPTVRLQVGPEVFEARARTATAEEKAVRWPTMTQLWPAYDEYQTKTSRDIPLVILTRA